MRNDQAGLDPGWVTVSGNMNTQGASLQGPMLVLTDNGTLLRKARFARDKTDLMEGTCVGFLGNAQRQFGLYSVDYTNLVPSSPSSWVANGTGTSITSGIAAPDGTFDAGQLNGAGIGNSIRFYNNNSAPWNEGDYWLAGEWVRAPGGDYSSSALSLLASLSSGNSWSCSWLSPPYRGDGEWFYKSMICKVTTARTNTDWIVMSEGNNGTSTIQAYAPVLIRIPAGTVSDNEAYEIWNNLSSYSNTCPVGAMCGLPGKPVVVSSYGTLSNCSSSASPAACGSAAAGSVVIAPGSSSVVVDTTEVTANSQITLTFDSSLGTKLRVTCNNTPQQPYVSGRTAGKSFRISVPESFTANPGCISYSITN